jgi:CDP-4-dehydro-6-deoxyglucose reductase
MPKLLNVSRAARLVGVSRSKLQQRIQDGEIPSFEGMVNVDDLTKSYPQVNLEDNTIIEKIEGIIENAVKRARGDKLRQLLAPDLSTLATRVASLSKDLSYTKNVNIKLIDALEHTIEALAALSSNSGIEALEEIITHTQAEMDAAISTTKADQLIIHDQVLRVMAAQVHVLPTGHEYFIEGNSSILEAGLASGYALNYGCSNGNCGKCKARLISGDVKKVRPYDYVLNDREKNLGYILTCSHTAITDIVIKADEALSNKEISWQKVASRVKKVERINDQLIILHVRTPRTQRLRFLAGQTAQLSTVGLEPVSYHIANCPCDEMNLQFHICQDENNPFARHIFNNVKISESVNIEGPSGEFILYEDSKRPLIFIAFDTGFAPIKSLIEHVLTLDANEFSHLYWYHQQNDSPYMHNLVRAWNDAFDNFRYTHQPITQLDKASITTELNKIKTDYPDIHRFDIYICAPSAVIDLIKAFFAHVNFPENQLILETL